MSRFGRYRLLQLLADAAIVAIAWTLAFELRFDHGLPVYYDTLLRRTLPLVIAIKLVVFLAFGFHRRWWRYVSVRDMWGDDGFRARFSSLMMALMLLDSRTIRGTRTMRSGTYNSAGRFSAR